MTTETPDEYARAVEELGRLIGELPKLECRRLCWRECQQVISFSELEETRIAEFRGGVPMPDYPPSGWCPLFDTTHQSCTVHEVKPLVCILWGMTAELRCPWGCEPERVLSVEEQREFIARVYRIGHGVSAAQVRRLRAIGAVT